MRTKVMVKRKKGTNGAPRRAALKRVKPMVGWREWVALPELGVEAIKAKVDTGARTSALHAFDIEPFEHDGESWIRFSIHPLQRNDDLILPCSCRALDYRWVTNSGGGRERRFVIETQLRIGDDQWPIEMTLTSRDQMGFRMLLGRTAIRKRYIVDPGKSYCVARERKRKARRLLVRESRDHRPDN
jgi:hypothetical protein